MVFDNHFYTNESNFEVIGTRIIEIYIPEKSISVMRGLLLHKPFVITENVKK